MVLMAIACTYGCAETVYPKNGNITLGRISETNEDSITIETEKDKVLILDENFDKIAYVEKTKGKLGERNCAIIWRPLPLVAGLLFAEGFAAEWGLLPFGLGGLFFPLPEFVLEGQTALTELLSITSIVDITVREFFGACIQIGPQLRPMGNYLKGFFIGFYPGIGYIERLFFALNLETGYQWIFGSGFVLGLSAGGIYIPPEDFKFYLSAQIGYAFRHPWIMAK